MKKKILLTYVFLLSISLTSFAQETEKTDENIKTGFSFGALPAVAYSSDAGFLYGALANFYLYGDGSRYPRYDHSLYMELTRTTKGGGKNVITYDSDRLIDGVRTSFELSYLTEKAIGFYGFNGYEAYYNSAFEDQDSPDYISTLYYRYDRSLLRIKADFQGQIIEGKLRWLAGVAHYGTKIATIDRGNFTGEDEQYLPANTDVLYDKYVNWGVIPTDQADGGNVTFLKFGTVYDTRDNEPNPNSGMWSEALFLVAPSFIGNDQDFTRLTLMHRQYFTLMPDRLTFALRASYQTTLTGEMPFYMLPFVFDSKQTQNGLGDGKNIRGMLRNRLVGDGFAFTNMEFRYKVLNTKLGGQNFYIALSGFMDAGKVVDPYSLDLSGVPSNELINFSYEEEDWHLSVGGGIRFALNDNFIVAVDYGKALNSYDGDTGLYIGLNWLF